MGKASPKTLGFTFKRRPRVRVSKGLVMGNRPYRGYMF